MRFSIQLEPTKGGEVEVCAGEFSVDDWELLRTFRDFAEEVRSSEWVRAGLHANFTIESEGGLGVVKAPNAPSDAWVRELLLLLRPFVLQSEATYFPKVTRRLRKYMTHPYLQRLVGHQRETFSGTLSYKTYVLSVNDLEVNKPETFDLWLNAFAYHRDRDKRRAFLEQAGGPPDDLALAVFRASIADKALAVLAVADFITSIERAPSARNRRADGSDAASPATP